MWPVTNIWTEIMIYRPAYCIAQPASLLSEGRLVMFQSTTPQDQPGLCLILCHRLVHCKSSKDWIRGMASFQAHALSLALYLYQCFVRISSHSSECIITSSCSVCVHSQMAAHSQNHPYLKFKIRFWLVYIQLHTCSAPKLCPDLITF